MQRMKYAQRTYRVKLIPQTTKETIQRETVQKEQSVKDLIHAEQTLQHATANGGWLHVSRETASLRARQNRSAASGR